MKYLLTILLAFFITTACYGQTIHLPNYGPVGRRIAEGKQAWDNVDNLVIEIQDAQPNEEYEVSMRLAIDYTIGSNWYDVRGRRWTKWFSYANENYTNSVIIDRSGMAQIRFPNIGFFQQNGHIPYRSAYYYGPYFNKNRPYSYPIEIRIRSKKTRRTKTVFSWVYINTCR